jgi:hypothetical protein
MNEIYGKNNYITLLIEPSLDIKIDNETFFRDYAVHFFLENELKKSRLKPNVLKNIPYYSNEFFENATEDDLQKAIEDIKNEHQNNQSKYQYYTRNYTWYSC